MTEATKEVKAPEKVNVFCGHPGGQFMLVGDVSDGRESNSFGPMPKRDEEVGRVLMGDRELKVTAWREDRIKGVVPPKMKMEKTVTILTADGRSLSAIVNPKVE